MPGEATSQHLRNAHELLLLVPLREGFVQQPDRLTSFASRLRAVLGLLFKPTQSAVERSLIPSESAIDKLQNLYHFHYGVVDHLERPHLFLSASFDSSWEIYFHNLVDNVGDFLDVIFFHCENFDGRSCDDGYEAFAGFVREHQVQSGIFFSALPDFTADDLRLFRKVARGSTLDERILPVADEIKIDKAAWEKESAELRGAAALELDRVQGLERLVMAMWDLCELFPELQEIKGRTARAVYEAAAAEVVGSYLADRDPTTGGPSQLVVKLLQRLPQEVQKWLLGLNALREQRSKKKTPMRPVVELAPEQLANIQGNILLPYARAEHGLMALMQLGPEASMPALLAKLGELLTTADKQDAATRVNVAFTFAGLRRAGVSDGVLELFPKEFREGMEARAGVLGDIGYPNHPDYWAPLSRNHPGAENGSASFTLSQVDFVLSLQGSAATAPDDHTWQPQHPLWQLFQSTLTALGGAPVVLRVEPLRRSEKDHFGLPHRDLESQPVARVRCAGRELEPMGPSLKYDNTIALGELLLGHPDRRDKKARCADESFNRHSAPLFKDGSFLVVRKLEQDGAAFDKFLATYKNGGHSDDAVRAALTGRDANGCTLAAQGGADPGNDFNYKDDPQGKGCPLHAHMRRTNPRSEGTPRIMRRSFPYGADYQRGSTDGERERGLMFMAYNASIAEQFETVQRWVSGGNSTGLLSARSDLLGGGTPRPGTPLAPVRDGKPSDGLIAPKDAVIRLRWGAYLFAPSRAGLAFITKSASERRLAHGEGVLAAERRSLYAVQGSAAGARLLRRLDAIKDPAAARAAWKRTLEESAYAPEAEAIWEELRARGTPHRTAYGVLVTDLRLAREILSDDGAKYSVRKYWQRMRDALGEHYLGLDIAAPQSAHEPSFVRGRARATRTLDDHLYEQRLARGPSYEQLAERPNRAIQELITTTGAYQLAHDAATTFLSAQSHFFDARDLARYVVACAARSWFDLPHDDSVLLADTRALLQHFIVISRYCFYPHPEPWQEADVLAAGKAIKAASARCGLDSPIAHKLSTLGYADPEQVRIAMMGALIGFVPPAVAHIATLIPRWFESGDLHAWASILAKCDHQGADRMLLGPLLRSLSEYPVPTIVYRVALEGTPFAGEDVVIGLQAVTREAEAQGGDKPERWLFGGAHGGLQRDQGAVHGCPARDPAIAIMLGTLVAVTRFAPLTREGALRFSHARAAPQIAAEPGSPRPEAEGDYGRADVSPG